MTGLLMGITTKMFEMAEFTQRVLSSFLNSYRCSKSTIFIFTLSFIVVFTAVLFLVSVSYLHPSISKYYDDDSKEYTLNTKQLNTKSDVYINYKAIDPDDIPESVSYNGRIEPNTRSKPRRKRDASTYFLPEEDEVRVSEDLIPVVRVPTIIRSDRNHPKGTENEALSAVNMALKMKNCNKFEKALKLFRHALALQPLHPDVLNHFGEFLEENNKDVIKADHLFLRALTLSPEHSRALVNRKRTSPVVKELDAKELKRIDEKHIELIKLNHNNPALNRLKKELYFQHIYHTVAIEGNTMTLEDTRMVVETGLPVNGKSLTEHMEIVGVEAALRYIDQTLVMKKDITVFDILEVHKMVLGHVQPRVAGSFRQTQVFVHEHTPPLAADLAYLMDEYVEWIQSYEFSQLHPVKQAALAHYKLVYIHPFIDGNGRTARLMMNMILMRYGYPPVIIRNNERNHYFRTLQLANEGDVRPFVRFIAHCTECTLNAYLHSTNNAKTKCLKALEPIKWEDDNEVIAL